MKRLESIASKLSSYTLVFAILIIWQLISVSGLVEKYLLPSPQDVVMAFIEDFWLIMQHLRYTLMEAGWGLMVGVALGFVLAIAMDASKILKKLIYPVLIITQTIPTVAIAPLLVLWLGYEQAPKITLVAITSFFPIVISMLDGFSGVDQDSISLLKSMGANEYQIYREVKLPASLRSFFSGLRISLSYSVVGAVVAEWLGGFYGIGVYMTRVRKSYNFDKMFAVIFFISFISIFLMSLLKIIEKKVIRY